MKIIQCSIKKNASTVLPNSIYPKLAFNSRNTDEVLVISGPSDLLRIPIGAHIYLAEPLMNGWGKTSDGLRGRVEEGTYYFSYKAIETTTTAPTTTEQGGCTSTPITFVPFLTQTGSHMDYKFRYDGTLDPTPTWADISVVEFSTYVHDDSWFSLVPLPGGKFALGATGVIIGADGSTVFDTSATIPYSDGINSVITPEGMVFASKAPDNVRMMVTRVLPDGTFQRDYIEPSTVNTAVLPYTDSEFFFSDEIIQKPDGSFYIPDCVQDYYNASFESEGSTYYYKVRAENRKTFSFKYVDGVFTYLGTISGVPSDSDGIETGGMTAMLNWKHIPDTNEMYYSGYDTTGRIDCNTDSVVWWVERYNDNDEISWVLPNKNLILPTINDDGEYCISEFAYADGEKLRTLVISPDYTGVGDNNGMWQWSNNVLNMIGNNDCELYLSIENDNGEGMHFPMIMVIDLITFTVKRQVSFVGDGNLAPGLSYQEPVYYGFNIIDAAGNWWFTYQDYGIHPGDTYANEKTIGFACFTGTEIFYYPTPDLLEYDGFYIDGNSLYYPTSTGIRRLEMVLAGL